MLKNKYKKILIISFALIFFLVSTMSVIIAGNPLHKEKCNNSNCFLCSWINLSSKFMENIELIKMNVLTLIAVVPLIQLINKNIQKESKLTLVELKVKQNK